MTQGLSNAKSKITGVCIDKSGTDSPIASVAVNEYELTFAHLPSLLQYRCQRSVEHDFSRVITVKIDLHAYPLRRAWGQRAYNARADAGASRLLQSQQGSIPIRSLTAPRNRHAPQRALVLVAGGGSEAFFDVGIDDNPDDVATAVVRATCRNRQVTRNSNGTLGGPVSACHAGKVYRRRFVPTRLAATLLADGAPCFAIWACPALVIKRDCSYISIHFSLEIAEISLPIASSGKSSGDSK